MKIFIPAIISLLLISCTSLKTQSIGNDYSKYSIDVFYIPFDAYTIIPINKENIPISYHCKLHLTEKEIMPYINDIIVLREKKFLNDIDLYRNIRFYLSLKDENGAEVFYILVSNPEKGVNINGVETSDKEETISLINRILIDHNCFNVDY